MLEQFKDKFRLDSDKWNDYVNCFNRMEAPARTVLLNEGKISKKIFLIEKGCIRVWFNNNGKKVTSQFFFEHETVGAIESFLKNIPSRTTIEPCILSFLLNMAETKTVLLPILIKRNFIYGLSPFRFLFLYDLLLIILEFKAEKISLYMSKIPLSGSNRSS